jgi:hypothetical protein
LWILGHGRRDHGARLAGNRCDLATGGATCLPQTARRTRRLAGVGRDAAAHHHATVSGGRQTAAASRVTRTGTDANAVGWHVEDGVESSDTHMPK